MTQSDLKQQVADLRNALSSIEPELGRGANPEALKDFKAVVDNVRLSVWAALTGSQAEDYQTFIGGFRLRRGSDICQQILTDIDSGAVTRHSPDFVAFQETVKALHQAMNTAPPPSGP